ncbi:putative thioredoxin [Janibacter sp. HTCC2649]|uniref:tetratricopeptide repeat protein n=1 Tax=Janibacter sp. HTCC2649 TaxID=313589 RepID=UPI0000670BC0|nr:tetratricopeptide repeat protein [Janibacter sp. HTCC2649]EAP99861.1 putative thioredoxin [Janibacter sp. HTCC2649]
MSTTPTPPWGARGAIDLSALASTTPTGAAATPSATPATATGTAAADLPDGILVEATDATFSEVMNRTLQVPAVLVIWSSAHEQTIGLAERVAAVAAQLEGRLFVVSADVQKSPSILQAFQPVIVQAFGQLSVPVTFGLLQGQPVPLFPGIPQDDEIRTILDQLVQAAVQNGITGRVELGQVPGAASGVDEMPALPPLIQEAYDAIDAGDLEGAVTAYEKALAQNPKDHEAELGLAQVKLMMRTDGVDLQAARAAAAASPGDVDAQIAVADLDVLGGHVADAFTRLIDTVKATEGEDRDKARKHLLELFNVVGNHDERVRKGRTALMNALF